MSIEEKREPGKGLEEDARGLLARIAVIPDATLDDVGTGTIQLRDGDDRDVLIDAVRGEMLRIMRVNVANNSYFNPELSEVEKTFLMLKNQYECLPEADKMFNGRVITWAEILKAIPENENFITGVNSLTDPQVYFINEKGKLILGDGCNEPPKETLGLDYTESRLRAVQIYYMDCNCEIVAVSDEAEIPLDAKIISESGLIRYEEELRQNKGQFEKECSVWLEAGKKPHSARSAYYRNGLLFEINIPPSTRKNRGSRCVFRVNLNLK